MKEMLLELISTYENRISIVEELVTNLYHTTATYQEALGNLEKERGRLVGNLQETLANNCSLRRKDFNCLMDKILSDSEEKRRKMEIEHRQVKEKLQEYLQEQKELTASLKKRLIEFASRKDDKDNPEMIISELKAAYQVKGEDLLKLLHTFESHLKVFQWEQKEIDYKLQRLVNRGKSLRIEDLRQLEAAKAQKDRKLERELRRESIEELLAYYKQRRQNDYH
jgi:hypothetical protein